MLTQNEKRSRSRDHTIILHDSSIAVMLWSCHTTFAIVDLREIRVVTEETDRIAEESALKDARPFKCQMINPDHLVIDFQMSILSIRG